MKGNNREQSASERLDQVGRTIIRASARNQSEAEAAASSPFLYARLRARINAEGARREEGERWRALFGVVWRAVPAMALVAVFALVLFLSTSLSASGGGYIDDALLAERDAGVESVVFADRQPLSSDDVLATILNDDERGGSR